MSGPGSSPPADASSPGASGQVPLVLMVSIRQKICEALETDQVTVTDINGDAQHVSIDVVSKLFEGQSMMKRQRMVYKVS